MVMERVPGLSMNGKGRAPKSRAFSGKCLPLRRSIRAFTPVFERVKKLAPRLTCDSLSLQREVIR
jgi:hypothetical protein